MVNVTNVKKTIVISRVGVQGTEAQVNVTNGKKTIVISRVGVQGVSTFTEAQVYANASAGSKTYGFDETDPLNPMLETITYGDANGGTNHIKTFTWGEVGGELVLSSSVSVFNYGGEEWTITDTLIYKIVGDNPLIEDKIRIVGRV